MRGRPVLTVTETPQALEHGSMINFILEQRRVRFEISTEATDQAGLTVSSRLLAIAMRVRKGELFRLPMASLAE